MLIFTYRDFGSFSILTPTPFLKFLSEKQSPIYFQNNISKITKKYLQLNIISILWRHKKKLKRMFFRDIFQIRLLPHFSNSSPKNAFLIVIQLEKVDFNVIWHKCPFFNLKDNKKMRCRRRLQMLAANSPNILTSQESVLSLGWIFYIFQNLMHKIL